MTRRSKNRILLLRSGEPVTAEQLAKILEGGGIDLESGAKVVTFQKALARAGVSPQDLAAAFQVQKALKAQGCTPEAIIEAVKQIIGMHSCYSFFFQVAKSDDYMRLQCFLKSTSSSSSRSLVSGSEVASTLGK